MCSSLDNSFNYRFDSVVCLYLAFSASRLRLLNLRKQKMERHKLNSASGVCQQNRLRMGFEPMPAPAETYSGMEVAAMLKHVAFGFTIKLFIKFKNITTNHRLLKLRGLSVSG